MDLMHKLRSGLSLQPSDSGSRTLIVAAAIAAAAAGGCLLLSGARGASKVTDNSCDRDGSQASTDMSLALSMWMSQVHFKQASGLQDAVSRHTQQPEASPVRQPMCAEALEVRQGPAAVPDTQQVGHSPAADSGSSLSLAAAETDGQAEPSGGRQPQLKRAAVAVGADKPAVLVRSAQAAWQRAREQAAAEARRSDRGVHLPSSIQAYRAGTAHITALHCM